MSQSDTPYHKSVKMTPKNSSLRWQKLGISVRGQPVYAGYHKLEYYLVITALYVG